MTLTWHSESLRRDRKGSLPDSRRRRSRDGMLIGRRRDHQWQRSRPMAAPADTTLLPDKSRRLDQALRHSTGEFGTVHTQQQQQLPRPFKIVFALITSSQQPKNEVRHFPVGRFHRQRCLRLGWTIQPLQSRNALQSRLRRIRPTRISGTNRCFNTTHPSTSLMLSQLSYFGFLPKSFTNSKNCDLLRL